EWAKHLRPAREETMTRMNVPARQSPRKRSRRALVLGTAAAMLVGSSAQTAMADETCQSPYMAKITGEEEFVYVWTLGIEGIGDGMDKVVTVDVRKDTPSFGKVIDSDSVGGRGE